MRGPTGAGGRRTCAQGLARQARAGPGERRGGMRPSVSVAQLRSFDCQSLVQSLVQSLARAWPEPGPSLARAWPEPGQSLGSVLPPLVICVLGNIVPQPQQSAG